MRQGRHEQARAIWQQIVKDHEGTPFAVEARRRFAAAQPPPASLAEPVPGETTGLLGDLAMRYLILRCGLYNPLIPSFGPQTVPVRG